MKKLSIFLMTLCFACFGVANAQTSFFSEDFEGGSMPTGWTTDGSGTWSIGSGDYSTSTGAGQGTYNALIKHGTTGAVTKLITPAIDLSSASSAELSFMHVQRSWAGDIDQLRVYYRTSSSGSWTQLVAYTEAVSSWTTESEIALPNLSGTYQLAFEYTDKYGYGVGLDDINIEGEVASCSTPTNLHVIGEVGPRSVTMGWDAESGDQFQYAMVSGHNIDPSTVTTFDGTTTTNEMTWNNLTPDTDYTVVLRKVCGTNDYSAAIALEIHTTVACPVPTGLAASNTTAHGATLSWTGSSNSYVVMVGEPDTQGTIQSIDFETGDLSQANFTSTAAYPFTVVSNTHSGSYCAKSNNGNQHSTTADMVLEVNMASEGTLSFSAMVSSESNYDKAYFSIDGDVKINAISGAGSWIDYTYNLTAGTHTLRWYYTKDSSASSNDDCFYVDDITITGLVPSSWSEYTANTTSITINDLDPATPYFVKVKGDCGSDGYSQESNIVSFTTLETCPTPQNLAVTTDGATATATWTGTEGTCNISINGTVTNNVTSPYTFNVNVSTTYEVMVQTNCDGETSGWSEAYSFTTPPCVGGHVIEYDLVDSYGDGWNGNAINIVDECGNLIETLTIASGSSNNGTLSLCGDYYQFTWTAGDYPGETSFTLTDNDNAIYSNQSGSSLTDGQVLYTIGTNTRIPRPTALTAGDPRYDNVDLSWTENGTATAWEICINGDESNLVPANTNVNFNLTGLQPDNSYSVKVRAVSGSNISCWSDEVTVTTPVACARPENLTEANITFTTADLSWTGTANSYVAEYGIWAQAGTDQIATATLDLYTFDLSGFSGKGTVAIRHYNVTDMFYLNVDDIVVKDANGNVVYSEDFESGSIPANISNIDLDGDGYMWAMGTNGISGQSNITVNGHYGLYSASWYGGNALNPDNWLVISDITLGGSITFKAVGQDASVPYENFAVYVIADNQFTQAYSGTRTSCQVTDLTEGTAYAWRVQGDCGDYASNWVFSMFKTPDNLLIFATNGNWNNLSNWTDTEGNTATTLPTADNKVRIDADAIIPAGVVATAKNAVLNGGSIEIEEGGQLKQGGTVKVTMHKGIEGYGAGNEEDADHYYFIATPHSCSYLEESDLFPYVLNVTDGNYDLYAFDPTQELEWINFESNSDHSEFHTGNNTGLFNKKGYLYANEDDTDLEYIGTVSSSLNNILLTDLFTYNSASTDDWNGWRLVGNPYTCDAYISYVDDNGNALSADFYTMDNSNTYTLLSSSDALAPLTGAMINFSATGKVQFSSEAPAKANRTGMINMNLVKGNKTVDQARVRFGEGYNMQHKSFRNNSKIYMPVDYNEYAVVYTEEQGEMPVNFKAEENGTYTLNINTEEISFGYLHLIDNMTGNDVDLLATPSYSFDAKTTDYESRFKLVFATGNNDDTFAFYSNGSFVINNEGNATLQVIDINGRILKSESIYGCSSIDMNAAQGIYMLRLVNGDNVKVQKVVVR